MTPNTMLHKLTAQHRKAEAQALTTLPDSVRVGPVVYQVVLETDLKMENSEGELVPLFGKVDFKHAVITIDSELTLIMQWQCFWHEVLHVVFEQLGFENDVEGQIDAMAYKLLEILMDMGLIQFPAQETRCPF